MSFFEESEKYKKQIDECFYNYNILVAKNTQTNTLNKRTIDNFCLRVHTCIVACSYVVESQALYINAHKFAICMDRRIIKFDYDISQYANRLFIVIENVLIPFCKILDINTDIGKKYGQFSEIYLTLLKLSRKMMYISARWICERHINAWEYDLPYKDKILPPRLPLQKNVMFLFDRILAVRAGIKFNDEFHSLNKLVLCMPPSTAKTFDANVFTNQCNAIQQIYNGVTGIIRVTNTGTNAQNCGNQCVGMVKNYIEYEYFNGENVRDYPFLEIYPEFKQFAKIIKTYSSVFVSYNMESLFERNSTDKILFNNCRNGITDSIFMFGMDAGINGKRTKLGIICDDLSNGQKEADNDELHKKYTSIVRGELLDRNDREDNFMIVMGTMYNENDAQNSYINQWENEGLLPSVISKDIRYTKDGKNAVCLIDIEDENGNSRAPEFRSNDFIKEKKDEFLKLGQLHIYNLMYRQHRDSREPKTFGYEYLKKYTKLPKNLSKESLCVCDPTRKDGRDFFALPFFRYCQEDGLYYLTDVLFQQKSLGTDYDPKNIFAKEICRKIIKNNTIECRIESNTSNTISSLLKGICKGLKYNACTFRNTYTSGKKGQTKVTRILEHEESIKNNIVFPDNKAVTDSEMFQFMKILTNWNSKLGQKQTNPDDAPDSLAIFDNNFIHKKSCKASINTLPEYYEKKLLNI